VAQPLTDDQQLFAEESHSLLSAHQGLLFAMDVAVELGELGLGGIDLRLRLRPLRVERTHLRADAVDLRAEPIELLLGLLLLLLDRLQAILGTGRGGDGERGKTGERAKRRHGDPESRSAPSHPA
jgi:hypothetical protein